MSKDLEPRTVKAKGYYKIPDGGWTTPDVGSTIYVPKAFKAKWLEPSGYEKRKAAPKAAKKTKAELAAEAAAKEEAEFEKELAAEEAASDTDDAG